MAESWDRFGPKRSLLGCLVLAAAVAFGLASSAVAATSPTTRDFMMTAAMCGVEIDANVAGSIKSLYDHATASGNGFTSIEPQARKLIEASSPGLSDQLADTDLHCVQQVLALK